MSDGSLLFDTKLDTSGLSTGLESVGSVAKAGLGIAAAAVGAASTAVVGFGKTAIDAGASFDSSMSQVAATMGTTTDQIEDLRDFAQKMGSTTAFSATQSADALNYMALAGYDAETSMEMLPNVLNLAAAGGMELASASDMVTDSQSALGLSLEQTNVLVDQMATASSKTNTSVSQLGEAILTIGGTAKELSGGTTELTQVLGLMADNGIKGAEAGTHLRNMILSLESPTDKAAGLLSGLGVSVFDANGQMRSMQDVLGDLNTAMDGMTNEEKTNVISTIFNKTDLKAVNALLATDAKRWNEVSGALDNAQGSAEAMASTQLDNLTGDITLFKSALEGVQIALSDQLTPTLREFVQFGGNGLQTLTDAFNENGLEGALDAAGQILGDFLTMIIDMLPSVIDAGIQLLEALGKGIMDNIPILTNAAIEIVSMLAQFIIGNLPALVSAAMQIVVTLASGISEALPELIPQIVEVVLQIAQTLVENLPLLVAAAIQLFVGITEGLIEALPTIIAAIPTLIDSIVQAIIECLPLIVECGVQLFCALIENLPAIIMALVEACPQIVDALIRGFDELKEQFADIGQKFMTKLKDGIKGMLSSVVSEAQNIGKNIIDGIWNGISAGWNWLTDKVGSLASSLFDSAKSALDIHSPSKKFRWLGEMCVEGFDQGVDGLMNGDSLGSAINASLGTVMANAGTGEASARGMQTFNFYDTQTSPDAIRRKVQNTMTFGLAGGI